MFLKRKQNTKADNFPNFKWPKKNCSEGTLEIGKVVKLYVPQESTFVPHHENTFKDYVPQEGMHKMCHRTAYKDF
jgi:hypothetical protein